MGLAEIGFDLEYEDDILDAMFPYSDDWDQEVS